MSNYQMVGIGEVLWDLLPDGRQFGGSPVNVVYHCQAAGIRSTVVSAIGSDLDGDDILSELYKRKISNEHIQFSNCLPTGLVTVELQEGIPNFIIHPNVAWDEIRWDDNLSLLAETIDAVAFGSLPQRCIYSRSTIQAFIQKMKEDSIRVFDINLRQNFHSAEIIEESLKLANVLKINDEELPVLANYFGYHGSSETIIANIIKDFSLNLLAYTKGANGSAIFTPDEMYLMQAPTVSIKDTVGAGDAFTGVLIAGLLKKKNIEEIHQEATNIAAWVCENNGAMPAYKGRT